MSTVYSIIILTEDFRHQRVVFYVDVKGATINADY